MMLKNWSKAEIENKIDLLKAKNANGAAIYVRPDGLTNTGLILIDDINNDTVMQLKNDGLEPCVVNETSPGNLQVWIKLSEHSLDKELATAIAKHLATIYNGDDNSADWRHFGRLAGFTNRKPEYKNTNGHYPFVKNHFARYCTKKVCKV